MKTFFKRTPVRRVLGAVFVLFCVWSAAGAVRLVIVRGEALKTQHELTAVESDVRGLESAMQAGREPEDLAETSARLHRAQARLHDVSSALASPSLYSLRIVPLVSRQISSAHTLATSAGDVAAAAGELADAIQRLKSSHVTGATVSSVLPAMEVSLKKAEASIARADRFGPSRFLLPSLQHARTQAKSVVSDAQTRVRDASTLVGGLNHLLNGPGQYLFVAGDTAEMVAGSGRWLQIGWLKTDKGSVKVSDLRASHQDSQELPIGAVAIHDADLEARWAWKQPASRWGSLSFSPRFQATAPLAADMWAYLTKQRVDGVVVFDIDALADLVKATGSITFEGRTYDSSQIRQELLVDQYKNNVTADRQAREGRLTESIVATLHGRAIDPFALLRAMSSAVNARHIYGWSRQAQENALWTGVGADGAIGANDILPSVINQGSKLDPLLDVSMSLVRRTLDGHDDTEIVTTLHNRATGHELPYALGGSPPIGYPIGTYRGMLSFNVPGSATHAVVEGQPAIHGSDGASQVAASWIAVAPGQTITRTLRMQLPSNLKAVRLLPSSRDPGIVWRVGSATYGDDTPVTVQMSAVPTATGPAATEPDLDSVTWMRTELAAAIKRLGVLVTVPETRASKHASTPGKVTTGSAERINKMGPEYAAALKKIGTFGFTADRHEVTLLRELIARAPD